MLYMWLDEVKKVAMSSEMIYERISSHHGPVLVYGTGSTGKRATELLARHGIEVNGYITGKEYFPSSGEYLGKPVMVLDDNYLSNGGGICYRNRIADR